MIKQAVSVQLAEPPLIATGHENIKDESPLAMLWKEDEPCTVIKSDEFRGVIEVRNSSGKTLKYSIPTPIHAQKRTSIQFVAAKEGTVIKKGDMLYHSMNLASDGQLQLGINARTAFMYYFGYDFEDSLIVSEAFANRLTHLGEYQMHFDVKEGERIQSVIEPGQVISSAQGSKLITVERDLILNKSQEGLKNLIQTSETQIKLAGLKIPNNIHEALVVDVKYFEVKRDARMLETLKEVSLLDYRNSTRSDRKNFEDKYGVYPAREIIVPNALGKGEEKGINYRVYFKIVTANPVVAGD